MPVVQKFEEGKPHDYAKLRVKCEAVAQAIDEALSSTLWNSTFRVTSELDCMNCGEAIRRRFRPGSDDREVACFVCGAGYTISEDEDGGTEWTAHSNKKPCPNKDCSDTIEIWAHQFKRGTHWKCETCGNRYIIENGIIDFESDLDDNVT